MGVISSSLKFRLAYKASTAFSIDIFILVWVARVAVQRTSNSLLAEENPGSAIIDRLTTMSNENAKMLTTGTSQLAWRDSIRSEMPCEEFHL
jgi:hypothetical protein